MQLNSQNMDNFEMILDNHSNLIYPKPLYEDLSVSPKNPLGFILTEFHCLLAYSNMIKGISALNKELVFEDNYNESYGKVINIVRDPIKGMSQILNAICGK